VCVCVCVPHAHFVIEKVVIYDVTTYQMRCLSPIFKSFI